MYKGTHSRALCESESTLPKSAGMNLLTPVFIAASARFFWRVVFVPGIVTMRASWFWSADSRAEGGKSSGILVQVTPGGYFVVDFELERFRIWTL